MLYPYVCYILKMLYLYVCYISDSGRIRRRFKCFLSNSVPVATASLETRMGSEWCFILRELYIFATSSVPFFKHDAVNSCFRLLDRLKDIIVLSVPVQGNVAPASNFVLKLRNAYGGRRPNVA